MNFVAAADSAVGHHCETHMSMKLECRPNWSVKRCLLAQTSALLLTTLIVCVTWAEGAGNGAPEGAHGYQLDPSHVADAVRRAKATPRVRGLLVAHEGVIVVEHVVDGPSLSTPVNIKSLSKTVLSALIGAAIDRGVIKSVDQPIGDLLGDRIPANAEPAVRDITVGQLLSMQSGLGRTSGMYYSEWVNSSDWIEYALARPLIGRPGERMLYSTGNSHILSAVLTRVSGRSTLELARDWLGDPLNIIVPPWMRDPQGIYFGGNEMRLSPRALLRIGELYRQGGVIDGQRVLPEAWVEASWQPRTRSPYTGDGYGYGWFVTDLGGQRVYYGRGFGGQMLYVVPELALTVVITSDPSPPSPGTLHLRQLNALLEHALIPAADSRPAFAACESRRAGAGCQQPVSRR
jgi:CubicO group peptidase (beta-lactamase class C family)